MRRWMTLMLPVAFVLTVAACEQEGPAERAGEEMDEAAEEMKQSMEDLSEEDSQSN